MIIRRPPHTPPIPKRRHTNNNRKGAASSNTATARQPALPRYLPRRCNCTIWLCSLFITPIKGMNSSGLTALVTKCRYDAHTAAATSMKDKKQVQQWHAVVRGRGWLRAAGGS